MIGALKCTRCDKPIKRDNVVWLELNQQNGEYVDPNKIKIPSQQSQGSFPFGKDCANRELKVLK